MPKTPTGENIQNVLDGGELLDSRGRLLQSGYALSQVKRYERNAICGKKFRIKEWDYYYFGDDERMIALTVADNSYMSLGSVSVLDFTRLSYITKSKMGLFPFGKLGMPSDIYSGDVEFNKSGVNIKFLHDGGKRRLSAKFSKFDGKKDFECDIVLDEYDGDNITIATPFDKPQQFYYNTKVNCLNGRGWYSVGDDRYEFVQGIGGLDWGRGVWPYKNTWFWSSLSANVDGNDFGLNFGYGFGKPSATENVALFNGKASKFGDVKFEIPYTSGVVDYLRPWKISDDDGRVDLMMYPLIDRKDKMNVGILCSDQHQVFGKFYGKVILDDGTIIQLNDKIGFAEKVFNKW